MSASRVAANYAGLKLAADQAVAEMNKRPVVRVGTASCGLAAGAAAVIEAFKKEIARRELDVQVTEVGCLGHCYAEPLAIIAKPGFPALCYGDLDEGLAARLTADFLDGGDPCYEYARAALEPNALFPTFKDFPRGAYEQRIIMEHCGIIDPGDLDQYIERDGYAALAGALEMAPEEVIGRIKESGLRGRGGAGFPTGVKWEACRNAAGEINYVICNGDEGDPGAFMDRAVLESNPHQVIEGMLICAYAIGAARGYLYIRAEYPRAVERVQEALRQAQEKRLLGASILGSDFNCQLELFQGSGAFVCGEATALVKSMEGKMAIPEHRPPRLAVSGFLGRPTVLNNVKTFACVPPIMRRGADWFKKIGTAGSSGTAVFSLVGKTSGSGLVEVPMGTTLRRLIYEVGEGIPGNKQFKAVQIGGPSGGCLPEAALEIPLEFDSLDQAGAIMGSGGLVVLDEDDCMVELARYFLEFTQHESCGKCTFCRLGTRQLLEMLTGITRGEGDLAMLGTLGELAEDIRDGSLCNLGKTAPNPVLTTLRYFYSEYEAHILEGRCPARRCKDLIAFYIEPRRCSKLCNVCVGSCPGEAIYTTKDGLKAIDQEKCVKCDNCIKACPAEYRAVLKLSPPALLAGKEGNR